MKNPSGVMIRIMVLDAGPNKCAHSHDIPGCYSTGRTWRACKKHMKQALEFHIEMCKDDPNWPYPDLAADVEPDPVETRYINVKLSRKAQRACQHLRVQRDASLCSA